MKTKLFDQITQRESTTRFNTKPLTNLLTIKEAKVIFQSLTLFKKEYEHCFVTRHIGRWEVSWCWRNLRSWSSVFEKIEACSFEHNPFDSLDYITLKELDNNPHFELDKNYDLKIEHQDKCLLIKQQIGFIENNILEFKQNYSAPFKLSLYWLKLNEDIELYLECIADFIKDSYHFQLGENASPDFIECLDANIIWPEEEAILLGQTRQIMEYFVSLLLKLRCGVNHRGGIVYGLAGYTHLTENLKYDYNHLPKALEACEPGFSILTNYVETASIKETIKTWLTEKLTLLKQRVDALKQGSIPDEQNDLIKDLHYSLQDWSKLCIPRPDFIQPKLMDEFDGEITEEAMALFS